MLKNQLIKSFTACLKDDVDDIINTLHRAFPWDRYKESCEIKEALGTAQQHIDRDEYFHVGDRIADKHPEYALLCFIRFVALDPDNPSGYCRLAQTFARLGQAELMETMYRKVNSMTPLDGITCADIGVSYQYLKNYGEGENWFRKAVSMSPDDVYGYVCLADSLYMQNRTSEAVIAYTKALEIDPKSEIALQNLCVIFAAEKEFEKGIIKAQECLSINTLHWESYHNLGNMLSELGKIDQAVELYEMALALNPTHDNTLNRLGVLYCSQKRWRKAALAFAKAAKLDPTNTGYLTNLGAALGNLDRFTMAERIFLYAQKKFPDNPDVLYGLGISCHSAGKPKEAVQYLKAFIKLVKKANPDDKRVSECSEYIRGNESGVRRQEQEYENDCSAP